MQTKSGTQKHDGIEGLEKADLAYWEEARGYLLEVRVCLCTTLFCASSVQLESLFSSFTLSFEQMKQNSHWREGVD